MVPNYGGIHISATISFLQRLQLWTNRLIISIQLWKSCNLCIQFMGWHRQRRHSRRSSDMRCYDEHSLDGFRIDARLQDRILTAILTSPRSMFISQVIGTAMGCVLTPLVFWFFNKTFAIGDPDGSYPAPYGLMYRGIAILGSDGFSSLPKHCMTICIVVFFLAIAVNVLREVLKKWETKYNLYEYVPSPMSMAIFYLGGYFAVDMCVGSLILFLWRRSNGLI